MACLANIETNIVTDQSALVALKEHILSDPSLVLEDYRTANTSVCDWIGVTCGIQHHRVSALNLSFMGLKGSNPRHLGNLSFLVSLDLSGNNFQANQPGDLSRLRRLWFMNFKLNNFTGDNPSWFGSFPELKFFITRLQGLYHPPFSTFRRWKLLFSQEITYLVIFLQTCNDLPSLGGLYLTSNELNGLAIKFNCLFSNSNIVIK
ncbi:unnamed protein product [Coffea canephora]|uniref:Leucine-rich repeat-containing N-terminal plant-type domain-containing protein n=1 Tax=Coffea canephora TaxID=49390 RepID=A0A068UZA5_COFCA|nr:unnamed protein product [Coffea canephora]